MSFFFFFNQDIILWVQILYTNHLHKENENQEMKLINNTHLKVVYYSS